MVGPEGTRAIVFLLSTGLLGLTLRLPDPGSQVSDKKQVFAFALSEALPREMNGWRAKSEDQFFNRDNIFDYMDGAGEIYLAFDFQFLFVREYARKNFPSVVVEVYQMGSSEDAYGVFTQDTDGEEVRCGQAAVYAGGLLRFWKDTVFARILADKEKPEARSLVMKMGETLAAAIPREGKMPELIKFLPTQGLRPQTIRYFHTLVSLNSHYYFSSANILNLSPQTKVLLALYDFNGIKAKLLLAAYPSSEQAKKALAQFTSGYLEEEAPPEATLLTKKLEDGRFLGVELRGKFLILVFEADQPSLCRQLADEITPKLRGGP
ncbi:MAG: DUF6599 family protein [Candidatus Aminicenantales bacterium]